MIQNSQFTVAYHGKKKKTVIVGEHCVAMVVMNDDNVNDDGANDYWLLGCYFCLMMAIYPTINDW